MAGSKLTAYLWALTAACLVLFSTVGVASGVSERVGHAHVARAGVAAPVATEGLIDAMTLRAVDEQDVGKRQSEQRLTQTSQTAMPSISVEQATQIALKKIPGEVTDAGIETKKGKKVYVIEIIAKKGGKETDVFVDMQTGAVVGVD